VTRSASADGTCFKPFSVKPSRFRPPTVEPFRAGAGAETRSGPGNFAQIGRKRVRALGGSLPEESASPDITMVSAPSSLPDGPHESGSIFSGNTMSAAELPQTDLSENFPAAGSGNRVSGGRADYAMRR